MARLAWLLGLLGTLSFTDAALQEVHIGTSYGYKTKCVATRGPVRCPRHVSYVGKKPDTFQISQRNGKVCARRTDYDGDWSVHLKVFCQGRSSSGISGVKKLRIGSSLDNNVKCVEDPGVKCDENAKQLGRTGKYPDTFHIYSHGNQICARRTDSPQGWGIDLVLRCQRTGRPKSWSMGGKTKVSIGSSLDSHVKCVDAPRAVHCDSTAKELGRTGKYPDTFHIYHEGAKICARRTDAEAGWGLDLVLECTRTPSGDPGYSGDGGYSYGHRFEHHNYASDYHYGGYHSGSLYMPTEHSEHSYGSHDYSHYHGGHHYGGSYGQFGSAGMTRVSIGSSLDSHVKCVDAPRAVHCDSTAKQLGRTGKYPDTFHIYHEGARICARRTDAEAGWGLDLELECRRTGYGGPGGATGGYKGTVHHRYHSASYKQRKKRVEIGSSEQYIKCVPDPGHVHCDNTASQVGRTGEFPDTFHIYHQGTQICARRTDAQAAWGIHLVLDCDLYYKKHYGNSGYASPGTAFQLGSSPQSALKCVEDPGHLRCDDSAEEVGRTGEFPDTFHIYHSNGKICAQRTDAHSGWGLNLVLNCRANRAHDEGHGYDAGQTDGYYITPKVKFCCAQHLFSAACPYDCDAGDGSAEVTWTSTKRDWCCRNRIMGCPGGRQAASMLDGGISGTIYDCAVADPLSSASQGSRDVQGVVTAARYDCTHGSKESWSQDKAQYCRLWLDVPKGFHFTECDGDPIGWTREKARWCQAVGLNEQHAPHKCSRGHPDTWSQQKFEFCCVIKGIGCRQEEPLQMVLPEALKDANRNDWEEDASEDALDEAPSYPRPMEGDFALELHFDCVAQDEEDMLEWSATRQRWCCQKWGLGCKAIGHFNCSAGLWNWQRGWSRQKKNYCCQHEEKGCDGTAHDCTQDTHDLSPDGKKWCCENHMYSNGCPFNCQHGLKLWKIGFSTAKKSWCCKYEQLACPEVVTHHVTHHATHHAAHHVTHHATHHAAHYETHHVTHHVGAHESHHWFKFAGADAGERPGFSACHNIADRPQGLVDWCCSELALCHLSVQFDCQVGVNRWTEWSSEKKHHCCGREVHCGHSVTHSFHHHHVHHSSHAHHTQQLGHAELDDPQAWFNKKNVMNLHVGQSPDAGHKCVTPSEPVSCPMDAGNVRDDDYPDRFRVYRKGGQVCAQRTDYDKLWGLDLVLKCIKLDDHHFEKVHIGSSLDGSKKCVPQRSPVTCDDAASQAGRVDPHPDTFHVYHAGNEICVQRTDADSHWGVDLVLYCRQGSWSSPYWRASRMRTLKGAFYDSDVPTTSWTDRKPLLITSALVLILLATLAMLMGKTYRQQRHWTLMEATEDRLDCMLHGRTPWLARPLGDLDTDAREAEMVMA